MRVLIVKLSSLGDVVHAMPVVHDIRVAFPGALVDWVVEPGFAPLMRRVDGVHEVIECPLRRWSRAWWTRAVREEWRAFRARLRRTRYDAVLDLQGLTKSALIARIAHGVRYGLANRTEGASHEPPARWLVDKPIRIEPRTHALDRSRVLASKALGYALQGPPVFGLRARAAAPASQAPVLVLVHGTSRDDKLWPEADWIELGRRAIGEAWRIALPHAGQVESERAARIAAALGEAAEVWPAMGLDALVDRLGATQGVVGVDSGLSHIAVALDLPHVQVYNFPTAWRTGPQPQHGHRHQRSVEGHADADGRRGLAGLATGTGAYGMSSSRRALGPTLALALYSGLLWLAQPAYVLRLWWRGRAEPLYRARIPERFGHYPEPPSAGWVWLHAVSLGETRAAAALVDALRAARPGMRLLLTHGTATGREAGMSLLREGDRQTWLPVDTPAATRRFFRQFQPAIGVLMETEIWPNLLLAAQRAGVPMVLANARLSERSFRRGRRFSAVLQPAIDSVAIALAQGEADAARLRASGGREVVVCGNLKYDMTPDAALLAQGRAWASWLGRDVLLAAVTREGEEAMLLGAWSRRPHGDTLLLIVPRHPQRFDEVAAAVRSAGLTLARRSAWQHMPTEEALAAQVWLGDSMREMALYYGMARLALLGGSFAPLGGQNLIEAASCACPLVIGPSTFNFSDAATLSLAAGASVRVADMEEGVGVAMGLLREPGRIAEMSGQAVRFAAEHRGAAGRMAQRIVGLLERQQGTG